MDNHGVTSLLMIFAYLCGSLCSAIIISKAFDLPDPRSEGSKNPGATNVLRLSGKKYALMTLFFDVLKGFIPVYIAWLFDSSPTDIAYVCFAAVFGHMFPVFYQFKGGKGIATAMGAFLAYHFLLGVAVIALWLVVANFFRYSSLASLVSLIFAPFIALTMIGQSGIMPPLIFISLFVVFKHRDNLTRLFDGTESKIKFKSVAEIEQEKELAKEVAEETETEKAEETKEEEQQPKE